MALLLEYQAPILVALWARFVQKESVRPRMWLGLALAMVGLAAATGKGLVLDPVGIAADLGAAVCFAAYFLIGEHGVGALDPLRVIVWSFLVASIALNLASPITGFDTGLLVTEVSLLGTLEELVAPVWVLLAWIVVLGTVVPFAAELRAAPPQRHDRDHGRDAGADRGERPGLVVVRRAARRRGRGGGVAVVTGIVLAQSARRAHLQVEPPLVT